MGVKRFYRLWTESKAKETMWLPTTRQCVIEVIHRRARLFADVQGYSQKCTGACSYQEADGYVHGGAP